MAATQALTVLTDPSLIDDWWAALRGVLDGPLGPGHAPQDGEEGVAQLGDRAENGGVLSENHIRT